MTVGRNGLIYKIVLIVTSHYVAFVASILVDYRIIIED